MSTIEEKESLSLETQEAIRRYRNGYRVASSLDSLGNVIHTLAVVIILGGIFVAFRMYNGAPAWIIASLAVIVGVTLSIAGTVVSAIGQGIKAQFDAAVHTSPFLTEGQKAVAMSL